MSPILIAEIAATGLLSAVLTGLVRQSAERRSLLDIPNARSSHTRPTPRGGGLAIVISFAIALLWLAITRMLNLKTVGVLLFGGILMGAVGFFDDTYSLTARARFVAQIIAAGVFVIVIGPSNVPGLANFAIQYQWLYDVIVAVALIWSTNLFNFMDGIDGIAGSEAVFFGGAAAWINSTQHGDPGLTAAMLYLSAASAGFLARNWPPARIFMGDVGSGFLGLMLPMLALLASQHSAIPVQVWMILGGSFFVDASVTLVRRVLRGDRWFEAHRIHAYQHLARRWNSHLAVTLQYSAINVFWLLPWAWYASVAQAHASASLGAALLPLVLLDLMVGAGAPERGA